MAHQLSESALILFAVHREFIINLLQVGRLPNEQRKEEEEMRPHYHVIIVPVSTASCIDTDLPAGRHIFGQSDNALIEIAHMHHAMWVTFGETCCNRVQETL
jgi:hypothetical protein